MVTEVARTSHIVLCRNYRELYTFYIWFSHYIHSLHLDLMLLNCGVGEDSWEPLGLQGDPTSPFQRRTVLGVLWKDWCWSWSSSILATWWDELTHLKRPWCWERLKAGRKGDDRGWDGWVASPTQWTLVWANSRVGNGQGGLACCGSWGLKELDMTERLNWN